MRAAPSHLYALIMGYVMAEVANQTDHASERTYGDLYEYRSEG